MNTMEYKGYIARVEYDGEDEIFVGKLLGLRALVSFHAETVAKLKREMQLAVDEYLASCEKRGETPEKPMSGQFALRMPPEVHGRAAVFAEASGKSLNQLITDLLEELTGTAKSHTIGAAYLLKKGFLVDVGTPSAQVNEARSAAKKASLPLTSKQRVVPRVG